ERHVVDVYRKPRETTSPLSPYATLFRSLDHVDREGVDGARAVEGDEAELAPLVKQYGRFVSHVCRGSFPVSCLFQVPKRSRPMIDRKSTRLNSSHVKISYAGVCLKKKTN